MQSRNPTGHSLSKVLQRVEQLFEETISPHNVWIRAEVSSYRKHASSGHHYFDLVEEENGQVKARCKANLWRGQADIIESKEALKVASVLENGREILCECKLIFHPVFGLSLHVLDIDSNFALGEMEKRRKETIARLKKENLLHLNRSIPMPKVIQRIAVIAAEGSAGLADLINQLEKNSYGFSFQIQHFNALVQGTAAAGSIIQVFESLNTDEFDAIVLIRGGGAALDLDAFNDYGMNAILARSPLPFLVGIGHETDRTVVDEWAAKSLKTPSAVGAWIVERARDFEIEISTVYQGILEQYRATMELESNRLQERATMLVNDSKGYLKDASHALERGSKNLSSLNDRFTALRKERLLSASNQLQGYAKSELKESTHSLEDRLSKLDRFTTDILIRKRSQIELQTKLIDVYHPNATLERGYSYLRMDGVIQTSGLKFKPSDQVDIQMKDSLIKAEIKEVQMQRNG